MSLRQLRDAPVRANNEWKGSNVYYSGNHVSPSSKQEFTFPKVAAAIMVSVEGRNALSNALSKTIPSKESNHTKMPCIHAGPCRRTKEGR